MADAEYSPAVLADMERAIRTSLSAWGLTAGTAIRLLNISENATWRLDDPDAGAPLILRVHRVGYHTEAEIRAELAWIESLRQSGEVSTAAIVPTRMGERLTTLVSPSGLPPRHAVAFRFLPGREPDVDAGLVPWFEVLGQITARLHRHAAAWPRPAGFVRKLWDLDAMLGPVKLWGPWQEGIGLDARGHAVIARAAELVRTKMAAFGQGPDRFGLVHADMRLANLLVDGADMHVIDFDDCGLSWHLYDFAAAITLFEHDPIVPEVQAAWVAGYRRVAPLADDHVAQMPVFIMARRILVMAWMASHAETPMAREGGASYSATTVDLAEAFLRRLG